MPVVNGIIIVTSSIEIKECSLSMSGRVVILGEDDKSFTHVKGEDKHLRYCKPHNFLIVSFNTRHLYVLHICRSKYLGRIKSLTCQKGKDKKSFNHHDLKRTTPLAQYLMNTA